MTSKEYSMSIRNKDIRSIMNLMESAVKDQALDATIFEDENKLDALLNKVIEHIKAKMEAEPEWAMSVVDNISDILYEDFFSNEDVWNQALDLGWPENPNKELKLLNSKFKEKYGMPFVKYADKLYDDFMKADEKSIKAEDKSIYKMLSNKLTVTASPKWASQNLLYYKSGQKVIIEDTGNSFPSAVFGPKAFEVLKMDKDSFIAWLEAHGIKPKKRPKNLKPTPPLYD